VLLDDKDDSQNVSILLVRFAQIGTTAADVLASVTSNTASTSNPTRRFYADTNISLPVIDNSTYSYCVQLQVQSDKFQIGAVRIKYTYTHP
jgi:hypothetical protein